jgi:hypothetical protein
MKRLFEIREMQSVDLNTYVFVKHENSDKKFLFEVPDGFNVRFGDNVLCDTMKGEARGLVVSAPFELDRKAANVLSDILGFYFPVKQIVAKLTLPCNGGYAVLRQDDITHTGINVNEVLIWQSKQ